VAVSVVKTDSPNAVHRLVELLGGMGRFVKCGDRVLVKPNVCAPRSSMSGAVTDPELVAEICRMAADCGGKPSVGDSPIFPFPARAAFRAAGYADFQKRYGFPLIDMDSAPSVRVRIPNGGVLEQEMLCRTALETDVVINVPVMKNHVHTKVTLGLKNMKGVVPKRNKHVIHLKGLDQGIADINSVVRSSLVIVDAVVGMEGVMSPVNGRPKRMNLLLAGDNVVETDAVACRVMGVDPGTVKHIVLAEGMGLGRMEGVQVLGEPVSSVRSRFRFFDRPRTLTSLAGRVAWGAWNWGYNQLAGRFGYDVLKPPEQPKKWVLDDKKCNLCKLCIKGCPVDVLRKEGKRIVRAKEGCIYCYCCVEVCPEGAVSRG